MTFLTEKNAPTSPATGAVVRKKRQSIFAEFRARWLSAHGIMRTISAAVLLTSAGLKMTQMVRDPLAETTFPFVRATIADMWFWEVNIVVSLLMLGVALLVPIGSCTTRVTWRLAGAAYLLFAVVSGLRIVIGEGDRSCGCFGSLEVNAYYSASLSFAVLAGIVLFPPNLASGQGARLPLISSFLLRGQVSGVPHVATVRCFLGLCFVVLAGGTTMAINGHCPVTLHAGAELAHARSVLLCPSEWTGQRCPLLDHVMTDARLDQGGWIVVLTRSGCPRCEEVLPEFHEFAHQISSAKRPLRLALIDVNAQYASHGTTALSDGARFGVPPPVTAQIEASRRWHVKAPAVLLLFDGVVEMAIEGAVRGSSVMMREFAPVSPIAILADLPSAAVPTATPQEPTVLPPFRVPESK